METSKLFFWLQMIANVALLAGLILVGIQISQSNTIARGTAAGVYFQQYQNYLIAGMGENPALARSKAMLEPEKLSPDEIQILASEALWRISMIEYSTSMEELGILDEQWRAEITEHAFHIGQTPVMREIVEEQCRPGRWALGELCELISKVQKDSAVQWIEKHREIGKAYSQLRESQQ